MDDTAGTAEAAPGRHWIVQDALQLSTGGPVCHFKAIWVLQRGKDWEISNVGGLI